MVQINGVVSEDFRMKSLNMIKKNKKYMLKSSLLSHTNKIVKI
jgi:hypothetical protein